MNEKFTTSLIRGRK